MSKLADVATAVDSLTKRFDAFEKNRRSDAAPKDLKEGDKVKIDMGMGDKDRTGLTGQIGTFVGKQSGRYQYLVQLKDGSKREFQKHEITKA